MVPLGPLLHPGGLLTQVDQVPGTTRCQRSADWEADASQMSSSSSRLLRFVVLSNQPSLRTPSNQLQAGGTAGNSTLTHTTDTHHTHFLLPPSPLSWKAACITRPLMQSIAAVWRSQFSGNSGSNFPAASRRTGCNTTEIRTRLRRTVGLQPPLRLRPDRGGQTLQSENYKFFLLITEEEDLT